MKKKLALISVIGSLLLAPLAYAGPVVTLWKFDQSSSWDLAAGFSAGSGTQIQTATELSWGATGGDMTSTSAGLDTARSGLLITDSPSTGSMVTNGASEFISSITHYNNAISTAFAALQTAGVNDHLILTPLLPAGAALADMPDHLTISFRETTNTAPCGFTSLSVCDDIFVLTGGSLDTSFLYDGNTYHLLLTDATNKLGLLPDATCIAGGAAIGCVGFTTKEGEHTLVNFKLAITGPSIPEPAPMALLGLGLLSLFAVRGRKNS